MLCRNVSKVGVTIKYGGIWCCRLGLLLLLFLCIILLTTTIVLGRDIWMPIWFRNWQRPMGSRSVKGISFFFYLTDVHFSFNRIETVEIFLEFHWNFSLFHPQSHAAAVQENKMTVTLIAVVVLFLVCQTPTAIFLLYSSFVGEPLNRLEANLRLGKFRWMI